MAFFPFSLAFGGILVPKTYLILNLFCHHYDANRGSTDVNPLALSILPGALNECRDARIQTLISRYQLYATLLSGLLSAVTSPYFGALSDRIGRRKVIIISTTGFGLELVSMIVVGLRPDIISVYWLLCGSLIDGLCGSFTTGVSAALAYVSDCTAPSHRKVAMSYLDGIRFAGVALGPLLVNALTKWTDNNLVAFYFAISCLVFFVSFLFIAMPESVTQHRQIHAREQRQAENREKSNSTIWKACQKLTLFSSLRILYPHISKTDKKHHNNLWLLALIDTILFGFSMGASGIILVYPQYLFGWTSVEANYFLSVSTLCRVIGLFGILPLIQLLSPKSTHSQDFAIIRVAVLLHFIGYIGYAITWTSNMMVVSAMVIAFGGIGLPILSSAIVAHVSPDQTGQVLGAMGLLHALTRVIAPMLYNMIYSLTVGKFTPAVFLCLAFLFLVAFILSWFLRPLGKGFRATIKSSHEANI